MTDLLTAAEFNTRLLKQVTRLREAETAYEEAIFAWAEAERVYKRAQAQAFLHVEGKSVAEKEAQAEMQPLADGATVNDLRYAAHLKEGLKDAAKLAVVNRRMEMSALQSEASLAREEAAFSRTGPQEGP